MTKSARFIYYTILVGLIGNAIFTLVAQVKMKGEYTESTVGGWYYQLAFVSNIILSLASIFSFILYRKKFPLIISICYVLLLLLIFVTSFSDMGLFSKTPSLFYSPKGIGAWLNFGILYFTAEEQYTVKIFQFFRILCLVFIVFNLGQIALLGTISNRDDALNAIRDTTVYLIWVYPIFFFDASDKTQVAKLIKYGLIILVAFFAFAIASRSYLLIIILFLLIKLKMDLKDRKNSMLIVVMAAMVLVTGYYFVANIHKFQNIKGLLAIFSGRIDDDTRSSQLKEFLDQYNWDKLFSGVGPSGTWNWSVHPKGGYEWLDNQFMLVTWWFGIITCLIYIVYIFYPVIRKNPTKNLMVGNAKIMIFCWILACAGLSIYVTISTKLFYYFITLLIGVATLNVKQTSFLAISKDKKRIE